MPIEPTRVVFPPGPAGRRQRRQADPSQQPPRGVARVMPRVWNSSAWEGAPIHHDESELGHVPIRSSGTRDNDCFDLCGQKGTSKRELDNTANTIVVINRGINHEQI
jgi:hypothetical protein